METAQEVKQRLRQAAQQVESARKSLPKITKKLLRELGGLKGRQKIREIENKRIRLEKVSREISKYGKKVEEYIRKEEKIKQQQASNRKIREALKETIEKYGVGITSAKIMRRHNLSPEERKIYIETIRKQGKEFDKLEKKYSKPIIGASGTIYTKNLYFSPGQGMVVEEIAQVPQYTEFSRQSIAENKKKDFEVKLDVVSGDFTGNFSKEKEIYSQQLDGFVKATPFPRQETLQVRPPTPTEQAKIDEANYRGSASGLIESGKSGLLWYQENVVVPISKSKILKKYEEKVVRPLSKKIYYPSLNYIKEEIKPKIAKGIKNIIIKPITKYEEKVVRPLRRTIPTLGETPIGKFSEDMRRAKLYIERQSKVNPEKKVIIGARGRKEVISVGELSGTGIVEFGYNIIKREVRKEGENLGRKLGFGEVGKKRFGKVTEGVVEAGAIVYQPIFYGLFGSKIVEAGTGGKYGGEKSVKEFVKKNPLETVFVASVGLFSAGTKANKLIIKEGKLSLESKYLSQAEKKTIDLKAEKKITTENIPQVTQRITTIGDGKNIKTSLDYRPKGRLKEISFLQTGELTGTIEESRFTGKLEFSRKGIKKKIEKFTGDIKFDSNTGRIEETMKYPKGIKKKTIIDTEKGTGTVELFKNKKRILKRDIKQSETANLIENSKEVFKKETEEKEFSNLVIGDIEGYSGKKQIIKDRRVKTIDGDNVFTDKNLNKDIKSVLKIGETEKTIKKSESLLGDIRVIREDTLLNLQKIEVGSRKGEIGILKGNTLLKIRKRIGQEIEIGVKKEADVKSILLGRDGRKSVKILSPRQKQTILQEADSRVRIEIFKKPPKKPPIIDKKIIDKKEESIIRRDIKEEIPKIKDKVKEQTMDELMDLKTKVLVQRRTIKKSSTKNIDTSPLEKKQIIIPEEKPSQRIIPISRGSMEMNIRENIQQPTIDSRSGMVFGQEQVNLQLQTPEIAQIQKQNQITEQLTKMATKLKQKTLMNQEQVNLQLQTPEIAQIQKQNQITEQLTKMATKLKQKTKTKQQLKQRTSTTTISKQPPKKQKKQPIKIIPPEPLLQRIAKKIEKEPELFEVYTREFGKDIKRKAFRTKEKAKKFLTKELKKTLRASGFIEKKGKKLDIKELGMFGTSFRRGKKESFRLVQKRGARLGTRKETKEIQYFRGKSKGGKRPFGL